MNPKDRFVKKIFTLIISILISFLTFAQENQNTIKDETNSFSFGVENDIVTRYIWHGLNYNHGFIHQPTAWVTINDFTFFTWGSFTQHEADKNQINNEIDIALQYTKELESIYLESSLTYIYALKQDAPATTEAFLKLAYELVETEFYSEITMDIMDCSGSLSGDIGANKMLIETEDLSLSTGASIGWANNKFNKDYIGVEENIKPFNYSMLFVEATYNFYQNFYLNPHIEYCYLFSPVFKSVSGNSLANFGVAIGVEF